MSVEFENPPLDEVVFGLVFEPIAQLKAETVGLFWQSIRPDFPKASQNHPVGITPVPSVGEIFPLPRFWFISEDETRLVQLQKNAFFFNWRKKGQKYPLYAQILPEFLQRFHALERFLVEELGADPVKPVALDLTYIDVFGPQEAISSPEQFASASSLFRMPEKLPGIGLVDFNHVDVFQASPEFQLIVTQRSARDLQNQEPRFIMELKAVGETKSGLESWFQRAHDLIIKVFLNATAAHLQWDVWKRK